MKKQTLKDQAVNYSYVHFPLVIGTTHPLGKALLHNIIVGQKSALLFPTRPKQQKWGISPLSFDDEDPKNRSR
jgi:hypothetical protein